MPWFARAWTRRRSAWHSAISLAPRCRARAGTWVSPATAIRCFAASAGFTANDLIRFETSTGNHEYRVDSTEVVKPKDVSVLAAHQSPELTLVTCYPFYYVGPRPTASS